MFSMLVNSPIEHMSTGYPLFLFTCWTADIIGIAILTRVGRQGCCLHYPLTNADISGNN